MCICQNVTAISMNYCWCLKAGDERRWYIPQHLRKGTWVSQSNQRKKSLVAGLQYWSMCNRNALTCKDQPCTFRSVNALEIAWPSASRRASTTKATPVELLCSLVVTSTSSVDSVAEGNSVGDAVVVVTLNRMPPSFPLFWSVFLRLSGKKWNINLRHQSERNAW